MRARRDAVVIRRDPMGAAAERYDVVVVGGGVYGITLALEAVRRGLRPLLLERDDFAAHTSGSSQRILHGGLRYLQQLDFVRHRESVGERSWFFRHMPELVVPLPCLMPLYGGGLRRPGAFRLATWLNERLSGPTGRLGPGSVLSSDACIERFPSVRRPGLLGAGLWYDAVMTHPQRLVMELLRWAVSGGATALNYVEAKSLIVAAGRVQGVEARDNVSGAKLTFEAEAVANAAGPWCGDVAASFDRPDGSLFRPSLAFGLLLDTEPVSDAALALVADRTYFVMPWRGKVLAGTYHAPWTGDVRRPAPSEAQIEAMLAGLRRCVPGWDLRREHVMRCYAGLLPAKRTGSGTPATRAVILDHARGGGPRGLISVSGVKWTTARRVGERALERLFPGRFPGEYPVRPPVRNRINLHDWQASDSPAVRHVIDEEAVVSLDDLLLRRTDWGADARAYNATKAAVETQLQRGGRVQ